MVGGRRSPYTRAMFTGIVERRGVVAAIAPQPSATRLWIDAGDWRPRSGSFALGDSVCVAGVCLTLAEGEGGRLGFDAVAETLRKTKLGALRPGQGVNLESSLTASTPLGGHVVQGHVDATGTVAEVVASGTDRGLVINVPDALMDYVVPQGSICIDGVSLTIARVEVGAFEIALIPTTVAITTLGELVAGDPVNLEADVLTKTVIHWLRRRGISSGAK